MISLTKLAISVVAMMEEQGLSSGSFMIKTLQAGIQPGLARDFAGLAQLGRRSWAT